MSHILAKTSALFLLGIVVSLPVSAQGHNDYITNFRIEARAAYEYMSLNGDNADAGFKGQWLNVRMDGQIAPGFTYSYRQRLNRNTDKTFFDATDWLHLDWAATEKLSLSAGKQVVALGGYEYDRAPIDLYYCSEFWNNISCYQFGISGSYSLTDNDRFLLQMCNSPFRVYAGNNIYAYNLMWYGKHGLWETMWSASMLQRDKDRWMTFVVLGNRFKFTDWLHLDVDIMSREALCDYSIIGELSADPVDGLVTYLKFNRDCNSSERDLDPLVMPGTELNMIQLGVEWFPVKSNRSGLKLFCVGARSWGNNTNPDGTMLDSQFRFRLGLKYMFSVINR